MAAPAASAQQPRERKPSMGAPISTLTGPVGPGFTRPKHKRTATGFGAGDIKAVESSIPEHMREAWKKFAPKGFTTKDEFEEETVKHIETTLARSLFNCDELAAYSGTALAFKDRLIIDWNKTQQRQTFADQKRIYYLSLEFLMGRALDNAMLNVGLKNVAKEGLGELGFRIEDVVNQEHDAALGNGGLGRLAACFLDSLASLNYAAWGYGLRYRYGIFKQEIENGYQVEIPDYWLDFNPWEFPRHDVTVDVQFYGWVNKYTNDEGKQVVSWQDGELVSAVAYDVPIPGYGTPTVNNLRLWSSKASSGEFDFAKFNSGEYESAVADEQRAETISAVLYPNDNLERGKELRLKQQYFWCAASLNDILRRFKKSKRKWSEFPDQVAIQLNDTHPTLAIVELQRILTDIEGLDWNEAWDIVTKTFGYTNHTVLPEALEKWSVPLIQHLLPRHLQTTLRVCTFWFWKKLVKELRLYIGSATNSLYGIRARWANYDRRTALPFYVAAALDDGFTITHKGRLVSCPRPPPALNPVVRILILALEGYFAFAFWTMRSRTMDCGVGSSIRLWDIDQFEYDGACSHSSLLESGRVDLNLTAEELEEHAQNMEGRRIESGQRATRKAYDKSRETDLDLHKAKNKESVDKFKANNPEKVKSNLKKSQQNLKNSKKYYCPICDQGFPHAQALARHNASPNKRAIHEAAARAARKQRA
ncbi:Non-essential glycogen phosphorylase [Elasticomyces elasticus]|uniref:Alpha-1,4 glucan phosphorylase n=1 Tax=Exophiala sideris TaxID=1016849 RepID=A0ABR0JB36_9EURO|nr:Non-essential glycogen phosphorylase [Elasticomyces elasticus]KAK5030568.1 Non-essential glycogen phosphorylase [Exophiala sideris]KAK5038622.1 Non-essential glycogen phosphorylase [Exophiala sideris]KAK5060503.1 Non-essential glycogen phosphorylase [Exophiala sideris]KAK5183415.1 Non-essential glycogen phosphorylase [Eurotiomycetes sp. CCFEE 6388]